MTLILRVSSDARSLSQQKEQWDILMSFIDGKGYKESMWSGGMGVFAKCYTTKNGPGLYIHTDGAYISVSSLHPGILEEIRASLLHSTEPVFSEGEHKTKPW